MFYIIIKYIYLISAVTMATLFLKRVIMDSKVMSIIDKKVREDGDHLSLSIFLTVGISVNEREKKLFPMLGIGLNVLFISLQMMGLIGDLNRFAVGALILIIYNIVCAYWFFHGYKVYRSMFNELMELEEQ